MFKCETGFAELYLQLYVSSGRLSLWDLGWAKKFGELFPFNVESVGVNFGDKKLQ